MINFFEWIYSDLELDKSALKVGGVNKPFHQK